MAHENKSKSLNIELMKEPILVIRGWSAERKQAEDYLEIRCKTQEIANSIAKGNTDIYDRTNNVEELGIKYAAILKIKKRDFSKLQNKKYFTTEGIVSFDNTPLDQLSSERAEAINTAIIQTTRIFRCTSKEVFFSNSKIPIQKGEKAYSEEKLRFKNEAFALSGKISSINPYLILIKLREMVSNTKGKEHKSKSFENLLNELEKKLGEKNIDLLTRSNAIVKRCKLGDSSTQNPSSQTPAPEDSTENSGSVDGNESSDSSNFNYSASLTEDADNKAKEINLDDSQTTKNNEVNSAPKFNYLVSSASSVKLNDTSSLLASSVTVQAGTLAHGARRNTGRFWRQAVSLRPDEISAINNSNDTSTTRNNSPRMGLNLAKKDDQ